MRKPTIKEITELYRSPNKKLYFGYWVVSRPNTTHWGCKPVLARIIEYFGKPDICFGKTDGIPDNIITVDMNKENNPTYCCNWEKMPFKTNQWNFGFWDPPYDSLYLKQYKEIWRVCKKLAILHTFIYPTPINSSRTNMIAITLGPMKQIRCLQVFNKKNKTLNIVEG